MKDDLTFTSGSHTIKTGFTYDRQQANGFGQQDIGGRARFSFLHTGVPGVTNFANAGGSSFASFLLGYANEGRTETIRYLQQIYPLLRVLRAGRLAPQQSWSSTTVCATNSRGRRSRAAISTRLRSGKPNPAVNNYPGALVFAGTAPAVKGKEA